MVLPIINNFLGVTKQKHSLGCDKVDIFNFKYTVRLLLLLAISLTLYQTFNLNLLCLVPTQYSVAWTNYVNVYCFFRSYKLKYDLIMLENRFLPKHQNILYPWINYFLCLLAFGFYLPYLFWKYLGSNIAINLDFLLKLLGNVFYKDISNHAQELTTIKKIFGNFNCIAPYKCKLLFMSYCFMKLLFTVYCSIQLYFICYLVSLHIHTRHDVTGLFPFIVMCNYTISTTGNNANLTTQCILPLNPIIEKFFIIYAFWLMILTIFNIVNLVKLFLYVVQNGLSFKSLVYLFIKNAYGYQVVKRLQNLYFLN